MKVAIIYLGSNNLLSLTSVLDFLAVKYEVVKKNKKNFKEFSHIILPGVGNYDYIVNQIDTNFNRDILIQTILKKPTLGICIGMQILGKSSKEGKNYGLGIFNHSYVKLKKLRNFENKVPNTGYREVFFDNNFSIFKGINSGSHFYFNHSFALKKTSKEKDFNLALTKHNFKFVSAFQKKKIFGTQFHPEKSKAQGVKLIANFLEI